ncbi:MAG TPA: deoxyribodipyrimidine photo-lyase [Bryobacteraceae bacterium]|nr:deoxyribodipyrimidine photo-lyase [Bryobacteraceae bacterium]
MLWQDESYDPVVLEYWRGMSVEPERVSKLNGEPERGDREFVLYWSGANRRVDANHALLYAAEIANRLGLPVLFYEGLSCTYPGANDRIHTFLLEGVPETAKRLRKAGIGYCFNLRKKKEDPGDALEQVSKRAAAVVADDYPTFYPRLLNARVPKEVDVAYYAVDSSCVVPMSVHTKREYGAYTIRPKIQRVLEKYLKPADDLKVKHAFQLPVPDVHTNIAEKDIGKLAAECDIDHSVARSTRYRGGRVHAEQLLERFLTQNLRRYYKGRNQPSEHATSELSPYLHFGRISSLEIALAVQAYARKHKLIPDAYLEELIVRRELAFNYCRYVDDPGSLQNLPEWCQENMRTHARDKRDHVYTRKQFEDAETGDELWNATQKEMLLRGKIHGYYRMYWGKKIIEWSKTYEEAAQTMIEIHTKYALDGRDPNTYTNILWCFGLHDRPWYTRPVFGSMRYMSLEGMKRKTDTAAYIAEIAQLEKTGKEIWQDGDSSFPLFGAEQPS